MMLASAVGRTRLGGLGSAAVGSRFSAWARLIGGAFGRRAVDPLVEGLDLVERALDVGDDVPDVFPPLPDLGKNFFKRWPLRARIAGHAGKVGKRRASAGGQTRAHEPPSPGTSLSAPGASAGLESLAENHGNDEADDLAPIAARRAGRARPDRGLHRQAADVTPPTRSCRRLRAELAETIETARDLCWA